MERIGDYEILSRLGSGGMAEVFLARAHGPRGFHRPVVIKRILPALAHRPSFIDMFLDEAEVVASLHHPNIVQIIELRDDDGLYMVMEYLEGESTSSLRRRRLAVDRQPFQASTVAHLVACVCAALDAAHNARSSNGLPRGIVHRDVAPENVFVTYDGHVKLLDFGVVWRADRLALTEAGHVKGKYPYMSPEQANRQTLDGRSDLFSLGALAYELSTGIRLFERESQYQTLCAVCEAPIPPPSEVISGFDPGLERIIMRALERDLDKRYQSAREMRLDALRLYEPILIEPPEERLSRQMHRLFADRIAERRRLLANVRAGRPVTHVTSAEVASFDVIPDRHSSVRYVAEPLGSGRRILLFVGGTLFAIGAAFALAAYTLSTPEEVLPSQIQSSVPAVAAVDPLQPTPLPANVQINLTTAPSGADVLIDGRLVGRAPGHFEVTRGDRAVEVLIRRKGFVPYRTEIVPANDVTLHFTLELQPPPPPPPLPPPPAPRVEHRKHSSSTKSSSKYEQFD